MTLKRAMDSWASSLRPQRLPRTTTATCNSLSPAATALGKRSLVSVETPKKSRQDTKRPSIEKGSKYRALLGPRVRTPTLAKTRATQRRTLIPVYQRVTAERSARTLSRSSDPEKASSTTEEICERLRVLEIKVDHNTELAQHRIKELLEKNDSLVEETDRLRILLQDKLDEIWELKEDAIETAQKLNDKALEAEQLRTRLDSQFSSFRDLEKKYRTLQAKFSIAKKIADFRDSESQSFRDLLEIEQKKVIEANERLTLASAENKVMQSRWLKSQAKLGEVHRELLEAKGNMQVYARIKAGSTCEFPNRVLKRKCQSIVVEKPSLKNGDQDPVSFEFDRVFDPDSSVGDILDELEPLIVSAVSGHDVCVLAYGQSGTGRTTSMEGSLSKSLSSGLHVSADLRIVCMAFMKALELAEVQNDSDHEFTITASSTGIHDEVIHDLHNESKTYQVRQSSYRKSDESAFGKDLEAVQITSAQQILEFMERAERQMLFSYSGSGERSLSCHSIYRMQISSQHREHRVIRIGVLNFVNLAASESSKESRVEATHLNETENSESSLAALLSVLSSLRSEITQGSDFQYGNSKVTQFLSSALSKESKITILAHVSPDEVHLVDSVNSMKIAQKIRELRINGKS